MAGSLSDRSSGSSSDLSSGPSSDRSSEPSSDRSTRRRFLAQASAAVAAFTIVPRHVLGGKGFTPPSEKLNVAGIGVSGRGADDVNAMAGENLVALCDVDWKRGAGAFDKYPKAKKYRDFRRMLDEEKSLDAVVVATPDHVHFHASLAAIQRGKHVYCEKPLTHSVWEARTLAQAAREQGVATQMGNQGQANEGPRRLCEYIRAGAIGPVHEVHKWTDRPLGWWPQGVERPKGSMPVPADLDWDLWLGPAPERPYHTGYHPFSWRGWWDFGTGALGDMGCHGMDPIFRALKLRCPLTVEASSTKVFAESAPLASMVHYTFAAREEMPPLKLFWYDGGLKPPRPESMEPGMTLGDNGVLYVGEKGIILNGTLLPAKRREAFAEPPVTLPRSRGHHQEWIHACKGGDPAGADFDFAGPLTEAVLLGNIAVRTGKKLHWDSENLKITNHPEANRYLRRAYRKGWG